MFKLIIQKEIAINSVESAKLIDALMHFSFLTGYKTKGFDEDVSTITLKSGSVMSLDPNTLRHTVTIDTSSDGRLTLKACANVFPWEKSKVREILSFRLAQLISWLCSRGIAADESVSVKEKEVRVAQAPFTHLPGRSPLYYATSFLKVLLSMFLCILGAIFVIWLYGIAIISVKDSRLFLEVTFGTIPKKEMLIGGGSVIGIAIGYAVGALLSIYFALCEVFGYLNKRVLSFGIFYALLLCFFIIEEEAFIVTSLIAFSVPFVAYTFYSFVFGLKKIYLKSDE